MSSLINMRLNILIAYYSSFKDSLSNGILQYLDDLPQFYIEKIVLYRQYFLCITINT
jgi:hypothetical protein